MKLNPITKAILVAALGGVAERIVAEQSINTLDDFIRTIVAGAIVGVSYWARSPQMKS